MRSRVVMASALLVAGLAVSIDTPTVIHGRDDRIPLFLAPDRKALNPATGLDPATASALQAVGAVFCRDGTKSTAFLIDVSSLLRADIEQPPIVATAAHALFDDEGSGRGRCWFRQTEWAFFVLSKVRVGSRRTEDADARDWAFASVATHTSLGKPLNTRFRLRIEFADRYDFERERLSPLEFLSASYMPEHGMVGVAGNCRPDDKRNYRWFEESRHDWSRLIIHDCDFLRAGSGGPLLMKQPDGYVVIGVNVGEADPSRNAVGNVLGVDYKPPLTFNYARRFDASLEHQLLHFLETLVGGDSLLSRP